MLDYPYVSVAEFRAHPTFLDSNNLRSGKPQDAQDAALYNALLTASQWADDEVNMPLGAHLRSENVRMAPSRLGQLRYHPEHAPVLAVTALATGATPDQLDDATDPQTWTEQDGRIVVAYSPGGGPGLASLQFGSPAVGGEVLVRWTYIAGWPATQLTEVAEAAATSVTVRDPIGITVGTVLRLWTPAKEEAVTVAAVAGSVLTLSSALAHEHPAEASCSSLPTTARQAVINYAVARLMRPAPLTRVASNDALGVRALTPSASAKDAGRVSGGADLIADAKRLLNPFMRIR